MAVQFHLPLVVVAVPANVCRCFKKKKRKKKKKERGKALSLDTGGVGLGVGGMRFNKRVPQGPGEGSLVTAAAGRKGGRERGRQATCWDEMGIKRAGGRTSAWNT